jgi:hypothetical protein
MKILVDPQYKPTGQITSNTKLGTGITCAKFLGGIGSRTQFEKMYDEGFGGPVDRNQVARNLVLHARAMNSVLINQQFAQHRLIVSDGLYEPFYDLPRDIKETAGGFNAERRFGRGIGYQLIDRNGKSDPVRTYELAVYWKDYIDYNELELAYDTFDPNGDLVASILLTMPEVPESYDVSFSYDLKTTYNGTLQARNELLEILPD